MDGWGGLGSSPAGDGVGTGSLTDGVGTGGVELTDGAGSGGMGVTDGVGMGGVGLTDGVATVGVGLTDGVGTVGAGDAGAGLGSTEAFGDGVGAVGELGACSETPATRPWTGRSAAAAAPLRRPLSGTAGDELARVDGAGSVGASGSPDPAVPGSTVAGATTWVSESSPPRATCAAGGIAATATLIATTVTAPPAAASAIRPPLRATMAPG